MKQVLYFALVLTFVLATVCPVFAVDYAEPFGAEYNQTVDSAFTFAFVGDTQKVAFQDPDKMAIIYDWLVEIADEKNLKYVAGLGDVTDTSASYEWDAAVAAVKKLDGVVPYSVVRGNHDATYDFVKRFGYESYINQLSGMYKNVLNSYQLVTVGTLNYLFLNLDHGPSDEVLNWAGEIIGKYPKHNVIITMHGYINSKGEFLTVDNSTIAPTLCTGKNDGPEIWDGLIKKYENIVMVVCGHIGAAPKVVSFEATGDNGNKIQHVLVDPQRVDLNVESSGIVALFHFSADGKTVQVENYQFNVPVLTQYDTLIIILT